MEPSLAERAQLLSNRCRIADQWLLRRVERAGGETHILQRCLVAFLLTQWRSSELDLIAIFRSLGHAVAPFEFKLLAKSRLIDRESQVFSAVYTFTVFEIMLHSFARSACTASVIERVEVAMGDCMYFRQ